MSDDFSDLVLDPLGWATRDLTRLITSSVVLVALGLICVTAPFWVTASYYRSLDGLDIQLKTLKNDKDGLTTEYDAQKRWFNPTYMTSINSSYAAMDSETFLVSEALKKARGSWLDLDQIGNQTKEANVHLKSASEWLAKAKANLVENRTVQSNARAKFVETHRLYDAASATLSDADKRFGKEAGQYLKKYTQQYGESLTGAKQASANAQKSFDASQGMLPLDADTSQKGDPKAVIAEIEQVTLLQITQINTLAKKVTAGLDYQIEAANQAQPTLATAQGKTRAARDRIDEIVRTRGYSLDKSLAGAEALYKQAMGTRKLSEDAAATLVLGEGKYDFPEIYEQAKQTIAFSDQSVGAVNQQVALADSAIQKISTIRGRFAQVNSVIANADISKRTLESYHNPVVWTGVANNITTANGKVNNAQAGLSDAVSLSDLAHQQFADANTRADFAISELNVAEGFAKDVIAAATLHEQNRSSWPGIEAAAVRTINGERSNIKSYGGYDASASNDFRTAESLLDQARTFASDRQFKNANDKGEEAHRKARGTGDRAYNAYLAEQARLTQVAHAKTQAEADRRAEAERQRQAVEAERARKAAESTCCSSTGGGSSYGGGSSSGGGYSSGGSKGNDGGGWSKSSPSSPKFGDGGGW